MFPTSLPASRYGRIVKAVSSGAAARLLSAGITLVSLPLAVRYLGAERYGVWATITTTVVWINLLDLGIANTLTNSISRAYALDDKASAARYFTNALLITGSIAAIVGGAFAHVCSHVNWMRLFNVSANVPAIRGARHGCGCCGADVAWPAVQLRRRNFSPAIRNCIAITTPFARARWPASSGLPWVSPCASRCRCCL